MCVSAEWLKAGTERWATTVLTKLVTEFRGRHFPYAPIVLHNANDLDVVGPVAAALLWLHLEKQQEKGGG